MYVTLPGKNDIASERASASVRAREKAKEREREKYTEKDREEVLDPLNNKTGEPCFTTLYVLLSLSVLTPLLFIADSILIFFFSLLNLLKNFYKDNLKKIVFLNIGLQYIKIRRK